MQTLEASNGMQGIVKNLTLPSAGPGPASPNSPVPGMDEVSSPLSRGETNLGLYLKEYLALKDPDELAADVRQIVFETKMVMRAAGIYRRARVNYNLYYARDGGSMWDENLRTDGDMGGSMFMSTNVLKNAIDHLINMVTSHRPAIDPITLNSSKAANDITTVAKSIIDVRLHKQGDIKKIDESLKHCPILGASFLHAYWNPFKGSPSKPGTSAKKGQGVSSQTLPDGTPMSPVVFKGDLEIETLSLLDVYFDLSARSWEDINDCVVRVFRNRYDLIVQYPDKAYEIKNARAKSTMEYDEYLPSPSFAATQTARTPSQDAMVECWIYYHKCRGSVPHGRMQIQLPDGTVLESGALPEWAPFGDFPVHRLCPDPMVGSPHGYAATTSAGGLQEALNIGASAMITNMAAFTRKLILAQKGIEIEASNITGDLKLLEVEFGPNGQPPIQALDLLGNQQPLLEMLGWLVGQIEQDTGANSIVRGDPQGVTAGVAINLYQSMALQFASPYEEERADAIAWFATILIRAYQAHPDVERDVRVIGSAKIATLQNFYGSQLEGIDSFTVDPGNPATRTLAMRYNMAVALKQDGVPIPPDKLVHLMKTGDWDATVDGPDELDDTIRVENETLLSGQPVHIMPGDDPVRHAQGHLTVLANPRVRTNPALIQNVMAHYQEHMMQLAQGDIVVKMAAGMIPMGPFPPAGSQPAHGDTPAPTPGQPPQAPHPQGPQQGKPPPGHAPGPGKPPDATKPPGAPPVPGIPGVPGAA